MIQVCSCVIDSFDPSVIFRCATPREMAEAIAAELFTDGLLRVAVRLEMKLADANGRETKGVGWCRQAVVDLIARSLGDMPECKNLQTAKPSSGEVG